MVIDTSALTAVLLGEPDAARIAQAIEAASPRLLSAATLLGGTSIVIESRKGEAGGRELDLLLYRGEIEVVPVDQDQAEAARAAWRRGKGRHPAALNYGGCFAYALASKRRLPLLFRGNDFARTDIEPALSPQ